MSNASITIDSAKYSSWDIISVRGAFIFRSLNAMRSVFENVENKQSLKIAIDFTDVTYIDSSAITVLLNLHRRIEQLKGSLAIINPNRETENIFSLVQLDCIIQIYKDWTEFEKHQIRGGT